MFFFVLQILGCRARTREEKLSQRDPNGFFFELTLLRFFAGDLRYRAKVYRTQVTELLIPELKLQS